MMTSLTKQHLFLKIEKKNPEKLKKKLGIFGQIFLLRSSFSVPDKSPQLSGDVSSDPPFAPPLSDRYAPEAGRGG